MVFSKLSLSLSLHRSIRSILQLSFEIGALKGLDSNDVEQYVYSLLTDLELMEKCDQLSKTLSGGQKRKLSVAIALIGGSKIIYLDEVRNQISIME
jgi:ABC-type multidrug transport system ATPase subunit